MSHTRERPQEIAVVCIAAESAMGLAATLDGSDSAAERWRVRNRVNVDLIQLVRESDPT